MCSIRPEDAVPDHDMAIGPGHLVTLDGNAVIRYPEKYIVKDKIVAAGRIGAVRADRFINDLHIPDRAAVNLVGYDGPTRRICDDDAFDQHMRRACDPYATLLQDAMAADRGMGDAVSMNAAPHHRAASEVDGLS